MKRINYIKFTVILILACFVASGLKAQETIGNNTKEVKIKTSAICSMCKKAIEKHSASGWNLRA